MSIVENVHAVAGRRRYTHTEDDDEDIHVLETSDRRPLHEVNHQNNTALRHPLNVNGESTSQDFSTVYSESSYDTYHMKDKFRRALKYYFMSPIDKWRAKGRLPWKLGLQIVKIILVTLQIIIFGLDMSRILNIQSNMVTSFRELFLVDWDPVREVMTYPPAAGPYAVYKGEKFYESVDYAVRQFAKIDKAIGTFGFQTNSSEIVSPINFCQKSYRIGKLNPSKFSYEIDNTIENNCTVINSTLQPHDPWWSNFSFKKYMEEKNNSINFDNLITATLYLPMRTIYLNSASVFDSPECFDVIVMILFDNSQHSGQMLVSLSSTSIKQECSGNLKDTEERSHVERQLLHWLVILLCVSSLFLCVRSTLRAQQMRTKAVHFFRKNMGKELSLQDQMDFLDLWLILIILNDIMIISGSILKIFLEHKPLRYGDYMLMTSSVLLGGGNLLVWLGLLRYLGYFKKYNIIIITLKHAFPHVLRFLLCALILYG